MAALPFEPPTIRAMYFVMNFSLTDRAAERVAAIAAQQGRLCEPEEVARAALFLASDEASFVNGAQLFVDNAFTAV